MNDLNPTVSFFQSTTRPAFKIESAPEGQQFVHVAFRNGPLFTLFDRIKDGYWAETIQGIRSGRGGYVKNKKRLPCFTPAGTFRIRCDWDLLQYSHIVHLDYDDVENPAVLKDRLVKSPYTLAAFISPSLEGLKVFVRVTTGADHHVNAFAHVRKVFDQLAGMKSDPTARNLSRLCYVSVDKDLYLNPYAETFHVPDIEKTRVTVPDPATLATNTDGIFQFIYNLTQKGKFQGETFPAGYSDGDRNNFLFLFACNCNRYGIEKSVCLDYVKMIWVQNNEGFSLQELGRSVGSAYSHTHEHATFNLPKHLCH